MLMDRKKFQYLENKFWENRRSNVNPSILQHDYLALSTLYSDIKSGLRKIKKRVNKRKLDIIDVGCGDKPYFNLFKNIANKYIGVDIKPGKCVDAVATGENLPFPPESFDLAISFQVLEHSNDPVKFVKELKRVLRKDSFALVSTHGVWPYHPSPNDYYRWTDEGLKKLFSQFSQVEIKPNLKSYATIVQIINFEIYSLACKYLILKLPLYLLIVFFNLIGKLSVSSGENHLVANYLVIAKS